MLLPVHYSIHSVVPDYTLLLPHGCRRYTPYTHTLHTTDPTHTRLPHVATTRARLRFCVHWFILSGFHAVRSRCSVTLRLDRSRYVRCSVLLRVAVSLRTFIYRCYGSHCCGPATILYPTTWLPTFCVPDFHTYADTPTHLHTTPLPAALRLFILRCCIT